jgi:MOSC domain-containing protein YiiM
MTAAQVVGIYIATHHGEPTIRVEQAHLIPGRGIEGDRFFIQDISSNNQRSDREITLIELEAIEAVRQEDRIQISPDQTRRNIVTRGIRLNDLVGKVFSVGEIQLSGIRLCEPCDYLASRTDLRVKQSFSHRGGLRASILTEGNIHLSDTIIAPSLESS